MSSQYSTAAELKQAGLPAEALEEVADADIDFQLQLSAGVIDSYLTARYSLPLSAPYPDALKRCNIDMAVFHILMRRGFNPEEYDANYKELHDACLEWLADVRDGKLTPPGMEDTTPATDEGAPLVFTSPARGWGWP